ncbi:MAG: hypothetical protein QXM16_01745 [Nitrososphaerota archaeon]
MFVGQRTTLPAVLYGLYLLALGLSFRSAAMALKPFLDRSHAAVWGRLNLFHILTQPETLHMIKGITGVIEMA